MLPEEVAGKSAAIVGRLKLLLGQTELAAIHCFEPIPAWNEVRVIPLIDFLQAKYPQLLVYTSRKTGGLWRIVSLDDQVVQGKPSLDCVVVPMLGFDPASLHRLGNGGGYYDQMLSEQPQARKIGVCFELGNLTSLPIESHDIALNAIVTEQQTYQKT